MSQRCKSPQIPTKVSGDMEQTPQIVGLGLKTDKTERIGGCALTDGEGKIVSAA